MIENPMSDFWNSAVGFLEFHFGIMEFHFGIVNFISEQLTIHSNALCCQTNVVILVSYCDGSLVSGSVTKAASPSATNPTNVCGNGSQSTATSQTHQSLSVTGDVLLVLVAVSDWRRTAGIGRCQ